MKIKNSITLVILTALIIISVILGIVKKDNKSHTPPEEQNNTQSTPAQTTNSDFSNTVTTPENSVTETYTAAMDDALFIGDSRTVGLMEYSGLYDADFFCSTGATVFNIQKLRVSVPKIGKVTLEELLTHKKYGKIYVTLGINELGYNHETLVTEYGNLISYIKSLQPNTVIFVQANLHVSKKRSESDTVINNAALNSLNSKISCFADNKNTFYIDANGLFDDFDGNLSSDKTQDGAHLYAKYYAQWGEWICKKTAEYIKEG